MIKNVYLSFMYFYILLISNVYNLELVPPAAIIVSPVIYDASSL